ncbi:selenocysteine lyase [Putridiphycobacter roseus]|uniref:Selenocysteine lyase n=1 Tax=Putridiphycobacter roseus TaxID=2219161 RepID=A0A2W1MY61_9FLAO|nr:aminotransferase class V-fold PLP-dependent enzyme [Putridiphycobacter roseus]PZE16777.1 selenocysteine lyase [Putridiphycobacter roseus]
MLEEYFAKFRSQIIGIDQTIETPYGIKKIVYADWTASGRTYRPIEEKIQKEILPLVANTHTETTATGKAMTNAYRIARQIIKDHVHATDQDALVFAGTGMTGAVNKFQRILGLKYPENPNQFMKGCTDLEIDDPNLPIVFVTHMEHHSNHTSWLETKAIVEVISQDENGNVDLEDLKERLKTHAFRKTKIASVIACSNVSGAKNNYYQIAEIMHLNQGLCFVDFACSGPYEAIDMHPANPLQKLDAIFLSPHKFLGGPGTTGIVIFCKSLYNNKIPDHPGGGTVTYTNPWGERHYIHDIETREDGGTPGFIQAIKTAMAIRLKEEMGTDKILAREHEIIDLIYAGFNKIPQIKLLDSNQKVRLGVFSFTVTAIHYNLMVRLLNDRFGIQTRGGCACAGTYGHNLLAIDSIRSQKIFEEISNGNNTDKPGWIRLSIHPTTSNEEVSFMIHALADIINNIETYKKDYQYDNSSNDFEYIGENNFQEIEPVNWFDCVKPVLSKV